MENIDPTASRQSANDAAERDESDGERKAPGNDASDEQDPLVSELEACQNKLAEMRDQILRDRADLENQRKRMQRDLDFARRFANEKLLADLLPVLDNLERGLAAEAKDITTLRDGIDLTRRELVRVAEASGLIAIDPLGDQFNPEHHQAMNIVEAPGKKPGTVVAVFQKGYVLNERLLRPAMVSVVKGAD